MIRLYKLYTEPQVFEPILFELGVNLIIGEKAENNLKTNGVGKTLCIEFINFCLLKDEKDSRVMKIPEIDFPLDVKIILDLEISGNKITIIRTRRNPENVIIIKDNQENTFENIDYATKYLSSLLYSNFTEQSILPSFRQILAPLMRDERSEFKDIINCYNTNKRIPPDFTPHLYLLGIDINIYKDLKNTNAEIDKTKTYLSELKKEITQNNIIKIADIKSQINELESEVKKMSSAIESLKSNEAFESIHKDLIAIETKLDSLRTHQKAIKYEIKKIQSLPEHEIISKTEISILYNQFKHGLGDLIEKTLTEVEFFKNKIDNFRKTLVNSKLEILTNELNQNAKKIGELDNEYSEKLKLIDNGKVLKDLRIGLSVYNKKSEELNKIRFQWNSYEKAKNDKENILDKRQSDLQFELKNNIENLSKELKSFEDTILDIHEQIMYNKKASFEINITKNKEIYNFVLRTDDDGSHSNERTKVFIYDMSLLFNEFTHHRHPKFLIHDNIFEVDQDTLIQCLNFLNKQEEEHPNDFQYILTLNRDKIENEENKKLIKLDINLHKRAEFTKVNRFLNRKYTEK